MVSTAGERGAPERRRASPRLNRVASVLAAIALTALAGRAHAFEVLEGDSAKTAMEHKQELEHELSIRLLEEFNQSALLQPLQRAAAAALVEIILLGKTPGVDKVVEKAISGEAGFVPTLRDGNKWPSWAVAKSLAPIASLAHELTAEQCSDIFRLYGSVVDAVGAPDAGSPEYAKLLKEKDDVRAGVIATAASQKAAWDQKDASQPFGRRRDRLDPAMTPVATLAALREKMYASDFQRKLIELNGGIKTTVLRPDSTVGKIERTFGLSYGSDISGTTSDTIWVLERFLGKNYDPIYNLLPAATIVRHGHHTLLEVGLALSVAKRVNYDIGKYTSLLSNSLHPSRDRVQSILSEFQNDSRNGHLLCWYTTITALGGCYRLRPEELSIIRNNGLLQLRAFTTLPPFLTREQLVTNFALTPTP